MLLWNILISSRAVARLPQRKTKPAEQYGGRTTSTRQSQCPGRLSPQKAQSSADQVVPPAHQIETQDRPTMPRSFLFFFFRFLLCCSCRGGFCQPSVASYTGMNFERVWLPTHICFAKRANLFMSYNALTNQPMNHLDNLQLLYWMLCFIITSHKGPELRTSCLEEMPPHVRMWLAKVDEAAIAKDGHISKKIFLLPVQDQFMSLKPVAEALHSLPCTRGRNERRGKEAYGKARL